MKRTIMILLMVLSVILTACDTDNASDNSDDETENALDPIALLTESADNIRAAETFRLDVQQEGADYNVLIDLNGETTAVAFRRAQAQYVSPDEVQGTVRVLAGIVPIDVDIYSSGVRQWVRFVGTDWISEDFAPGFNAATLIEEDTGFEAALSALADLDYSGEESLEDGTPVYHIAGTAEGEAVTSLLVGMIETEGLVPVDVYLHREERYPVRIVIHQVDNATEENPEGTIWTIDVFDVDDAPELTPPQGADVDVETTAEATAEATAEVND